MAAARRASRAAAASARALSSLVRNSVTSAALRRSVASSAASAVARFSSASARRCSLHAAAAVQCWLAGRMKSGHQALVCPQQRCKRQRLPLPALPPAPRHASPRPPCAAAACIDDVSSGKRGLQSGLSCAGCLASARTPSTKHGHCRSIICQCRAVFSSAFVRRYTSLHSLSRHSSTSTGQSLSVRRARKYICVFSLESGSVSADGCTATPR